MKLDNETRAFLKSEKKEFENKTPMTAKERRKLRKWVEDGNSVYSNPYDLYDDAGRLMDFITARRTEKYHREAEIKSSHKLPESTEEQLFRLRQELFHLWMFLSKEELYDEAVEYIQDNTGAATPFEMLF